MAKNFHKKNYINKDRDNEELDVSLVETPVVGQGLHIKTSISLELII